MTWKYEKRDYQHGHNPHMRWAGLPRDAIRNVPAWAPNKRGQQLSWTEEMERALLLYAGCPGSTYSTVATALNALYKPAYFNRRMVARKLHDLRKRGAVGNKQRTKNG